MRGGRSALCLVLLCWLAPQASQAHEVRPGYLELRELDAERYDVLWKVPARGDRRLGIYVALPESCRSGEPQVRSAGGAHIERWRVSCDGGLVGGRVAIEGLAATRTDVLARVERADGTSQTVRLTPEAAAFSVSAASSRLEVARTYLALGVEHILLGVDHLLFVLALLFLAGSVPRLVGTVTAFTVAHSLTLAAATLGWIRLPPPAVEAAIALSIVFVAAEVLHARAGRPSLARRKPWLVAFAFGLLHGLGFAGALREVGLPEHAIPLALACFNLGVELGQLAFVALALALFWLARPLLRRSGRDAWSVAGLVSAPSAYAIGTLAAFWLIERTARFWGA